MKIILRNIIIGIICFLGMMLGIAITINTIRIIFNYDSLFFKIFKTSFYPTLIVFAITVPSIFIAPKLFKRLYYYLAIIYSWFIYNLWALIFYSLLNIFINPGIVINFILFIIVGTVTTIYAEINDRHPQFDEKKLYCSKLPNGEIVNIIHLTDLHLGACYDENYVKMLIYKILDFTKKKSINIDLVVITGDLIDGNIKITKEMLEPFNLFECPIYYVSGNHEDYTWKEEAFNLIENNSKITHIPNDVVNFQNKFNIIGVDYNFNWSISYNNLKNLLEGINNNLPNIFLYHTPLIRTEYLKNLNIFLFLCGHMHGGQMFPFSVIRHFARKDRIFEGLYESNDSENGENHYVYCCAGTGSSGPCGRTFITPNVGILCIEGKN